MKRKLQTNVTAIFAAATLAFTGAVPIVNAASQMLSIPYVENYDSYADVTYTGPFYDGVNNMGVNQFYGAGAADTIGITSDADAPEHGKVIKSVSDGSTEHQIRFTFNQAQTSGKVLIKFDLKAQNNNTMYLRPNTDSWLSDISMTANNVLFDGSNAQTTYAVNQYNQVQFLYDLDNDTVTSYFNDVYATKSFTAASLKGFIFQPQGGQPGDTIYIDNFEIRKISGTTVESTLYAGDDTKISAYSPVTDSLKIALADSDFFTSLPDVTLADLGNNPIVIDEKPVTTAPSIKKGALNLKLSSALEEGHRYRITIPEGTRSGYLRKLTTTTFEFTALSDGGIKKEEFGEDFSTINELSAVSRGSNIAEGSLLKYYSAKSSTKTYELAQDSECTDGKGLKFKGDRAVILETDNGQNMTSGKLKLEARYKVNSGTAKISLGNSGIVNGIPLLETKTNSNTIYYQNSNVALGLQKKYTTADGGWVVAKYTLDLDNKKLTYDINGTVGEESLPYYDTVSTNNLLTDGLGFIRFEDLENNCEAVLDYIKLTKIYEGATILKAVFTTVDGNSNIYAKNTELEPAVNSMTLYFSGKVNGSALEDITVAMQDGTMEDIDIEYNQNANSCKILFNNYLKQKCDYMINIPNTVTGDEINATVRTGEGKLCVMSTQFKNATGNITTSPNEAVALTINIINTAEEDHSYSLVFAAHDGLFLKNMLYKDFDITKDQRKFTFSMPVKADENADSIQGFLWSDMEHIIPTKLN